MITSQTLAIAEKALLEGRDSPEIDALCQTNIESLPKELQATAERVLLISALIEANKWLQVLQGPERETHLQSFQKIEGKVAHNLAIFKKVRRRLPDEIHFLGNQVTKALQKYREEQRSTSFLSRLYSLSTVHLVIPFTLAYSYITGDYKGLLLGIASTVATYAANC